MWYLFYTDDALGCSSEGKLGIVSTYCIELKLASEVTAFLTFNFLETVYDSVMCMYVCVCVCGGGHSRE